MSNKYRLTSNAFEREKEEDKIEPSRLLFLSMEGSDTEKEYIDGLNKYKNELNLNSTISIEPLFRRKKDGSTAPKLVIELLEEYLTLRKEGIDVQIKQLLNNDYSSEIITNYINNPSLLSPATIKEIDFKLEKIGYDLQYKKYLENIKKDGDLFGIVIDKDSWDNIEEIIDYCKEKGYYVFISNPCFELWLLFHWIDISTLPNDKQNLIALNPKKSNKHTYVSYYLSDIAHHGKTRISFKTKYLNKLDIAIQNANKFETDLTKLPSKMGTNWPSLINLLKENLK